MVGPAWLERTAFCSSLPAVWKLGFLWHVVEVATPSASAQLCALPTRVSHRHDDVPGHRGPHEQGDHAARAVVNEGQGGCAARAQVQCLDRWLHPGVAVHLPADVDCQERVRSPRNCHLLLR